MGYSKPEMLAPDATIPMAKPFLALNQVDTTTFDSVQHMILLSVGYTGTCGRERGSEREILTLRRSDEETRHAQSSEEALSKPDQTVVALIVLSIAVDDREEERSQRDEDGSNNHECSAVSRIKESTNRCRE